MFKNPRKFLMGKKFIFYGLTITDKSGLMEFTENFLKQHAKNPRLYDIEEVAHYFVRQIEESFNNYDTIADSEEWAFFMFTDTRSGNPSRIEFEDIEEFVTIVKKRWR